MSEPGSRIETLRERIEESNGIADEEPMPIAPIECPRCGKETPRDEELWVWCKQATDHGAIEKVKTEAEELRDAILRLIREDPGIIDDIRSA